MKKANHKDTKIKKKGRKRAVSGYLETIEKQVSEINELRAALDRMGELVAQSKREADTDFETIYALKSAICVLTREEVGL